jgi:hypothetical protein
MKPDSPTAGIATGVLVEVAKGLETANGQASLFKALWGNDLIALWSDDSAPSPFLKGLSIGDNVRFHWEAKTETNEHGVKERRVFTTALPSA